MVFTNKPGKGNQGQSNGNRPQNEPYMNASPSRAMTGPIHPQSGEDGYYQNNPYGNNQYQNPYYDPRMNDPRYQDPRLNPYGNQSPYPDPYYGQAPQQNPYGSSNPQQNQRQTGRADDLKGLSFWREEDENGYYDNAEDQEEKTSQLKFLVIIAGLVIASGLLWLGYRFSTQSDVQIIPLIPAEQGPYKRRPENPGGMAFPHQEMLVYGRLSPDQQNGQPIERIMPEQEQYYIPEGQPQQGYVDQQQHYATPSPTSVDVNTQYQQQPVPQGYQQVQQPQPMMQPQQVMNQPQSIPQQPVVEQVVHPQQESLASPSPSPSQSIQSNTEVTKKVEGSSEIKKEVKSEKVSDIKQEKVKDKKTSSVDLVKTALDNGYYMQLASLPTEASAKKELSRLRQKHKDLSLFIQPFEAGVKKYHRVVVGPFSDRDIALKKCIHVGNGCKVINITGNNG